MIVRPLHSTALPMEDDEIPGVVILRGHFKEDLEVMAINEALNLIDICPPWEPDFPGRAPVPLFNTAAGALAWVARGEENVYLDTRPDGEPLPPMPDMFRNDAETIGKIYYPDYIPESLLINIYDRKGQSYRLHRDREELVPAPIYSLSLGVDCDFLVGGRDMKKDPVRKVRLRSGDLLILEGEARDYFHGVGKVFYNYPHPILGAKRINVTVRMVNPPEHYGRSGVGTKPFTEPEFKG